MQKALPFSAMVVLALALGACGDGCKKKLANLDGEPVSSAHANVTEPPAAPSNTPEGWLKTDKNQILTWSNLPFHGRGANIHDTRSCDACTYEEPNVAEVLRRIDALVDGWHANFIRLLMESYEPVAGRTHGKSALEDPAYVEDLKKIVAHVGTKKGVYLELSVWKDASLNQMGWPSLQTTKLWEKLAEVFKTVPYVMFGLVNEPERNVDGKLDESVWKAMNRTVEAIRKVEGDGPHHIVLVQGTREWGRSLDYYMEHPIAAGGGVNVAYETHVYDSEKKFDQRFVRASKKLPVVIGEYGPESKLANMTLDDCKKLQDVAEAAGVPYLAYTFHMRCPPNLLEDRSAMTCGVGMDLEPSVFGKLVKERLAKPW